MNTAPICCLVNLTGYCSSCPSPPSGYSAYNGKHYKYFGILDERTYQDAANLCLQDGALLAMPKSQAEIDHINGLTGAVKVAHILFFQCYAMTFIPRVLECFGFCI